MVSFFWQRGFYYNRQFFFYDETTLFSIHQLFGLSSLFWRYFFNRCEGFKALPHLTPTKLLTYTNRRTSLTVLKTHEQYLLNRLLVCTYPILLNFYLQLRLNLLFFFFARTYRGFALRYSRPLRRRTRGRTFYRRHMAKPPTLGFIRTNTSRWF